MSLNVPTTLSAPRPRMPRRLDSRGFTLIELMVVVVIIGILAAIGSANFHRLKKSAQRGACVATQHDLMAPAVLYVLEQDVLTANLNVRAITGPRYVAERQGECPASIVEDFDDYTIQVVDGVVLDVTCTFKGEEHPFDPMK